MPNSFRDRRTVLSPPLQANPPRVALKVNAFRKFEGSDLPDLWRTVINGPMIHPRRRRCDLVWLGQISG